MNRSDYFIEKGKYSIIGVLCVYTVYCTYLLSGNVLYNSKKASMKQQMNFFL